MEKLHRQYKYEVKATQSIVFGQYSLCIRGPCLADMRKDLINRVEVFWDVLMYSCYAQRQLPK